MSLKVVVLSKTLLVRQPIAQSLAPLDFQVHESSDLSDVVARLNILAPALIVMDADGMAREWRMLAAGLGASRGGVALVLLTSRFGFDDAHEAMGLKVAGVIVKPFRREEHTARILDLTLRKMGIRAKRAAPRFLIPEEMRPRLQYALSGSEEILPVKNVSEGGAAVRREAAGSEAGFSPGAFIPSATLSWGEVTVDLAVEVAHRGQDVVGLRFSRIFEGKSKFLRALEERYARALGEQGKKQKW